MQSLDHLRVSDRQARQGTEVKNDGKGNERIAESDLAQFSVNYPVLPKPTPTPAPSPSEKSFTFMTASVTPNGKLMKRRSEGQRHTFDLEGTPLEMIWIPTGDFLMGAPKWEGYDEERPRRRVTFTSGFWMGRYPVTQAQWKWVSKLDVVSQQLDAAPSRFKGNARPVEKVSWDDAREFCTRLSQVLSEEFRLPSEAQWEYACRAGTTTPFAFGEILTPALASYGGRFNGGRSSSGHKPVKETTEVGQFPANAWGLQDMHGNVREWCEDSWSDSYRELPVNGDPWVDESLLSRTLRGGSWQDYSRLCRSASRVDRLRGDRFNFIGFRLVCISTLR